MRTICLNLMMLGAVFLLLPPCVLANSAVLKGLGRGGFDIEVEPLDSEARKAGLKEAGLAKVLRTGLQKHNIPFRSNAEAQLYARVVVLTSRAVNGEVLGYGAHVELSVREKALLKRDRSTEFMAPIWFKGNVTVANPKQFVREVIGALNTLLEQFFRDFSKVNPLRSSPR